LENHSRFQSDPTFGSLDILHKSADVTLALPGKRQGRTSLTRRRTVCPLAHACKRSMGKDAHWREAQESK